MVFVDPAMFPLQRCTRDSLAMSAPRCRVGSARPRYPQTYMIRTKLTVKKEQDAERPGGRLRPQRSGDRPSMTIGALARAASPTVHGAASTQPRPDDGPFAVIEAVV